MPLEFLESVQQFGRSEGGGGLEIAPPLTGARYKNTPAGRWLMGSEGKHPHGESKALQGTSVQEIRTRDGASYWYQNSCVDNSIQQKTGFNPLFFSHVLFHVHA